MAGSGREVGTQMPTSAGVFTRASSGLVRQVRTDDVMYYGWQQIALSYIVFIVLGWVAYPGASMELATILAIAGGVALAVCYGLLSSVYPRSGGEYVFVSRILHPLPGFIVSVSFAFWETFYFGINGAFFSLFALAPFLSALGEQLGNQAMLDLATWFSSGIGMFVAGGAMVLLFAFLAYRGAAVYFRWQRWASYVALASIIITALVLAAGAVGILDFKANFDAVVGAGAYDAVVAEGAAAGVVPAPAFDLAQTLNYMIWPAFSIWFAVAAVSFSGEIKNVGRGQLIGIPAAMITMGGIMAVFMFLYQGAFGTDFLLAASASESFPLAGGPFVNLFTAILGGSPILTILTSLWALLIALFVGGTVLIYATRAMVAWGIDGVAPEPLAAVSSRYHSPVNAIIVATIGGLIALALFSFTDVLGPITGFLGLSFSFIAVVLTAILFPFVRRSAFENSPAAMRVAGIPVITIVGLIAAVFVGFVVYRLLVDDTFGANATSSLVIAGAVVVVAAVWFFVAKWYRRSQGTDLDRRYAEIPIE